MILRFDNTRAAGVFVAQWAILAGFGIPHMFWTNNVLPCQTSRISIWWHAFVPFPDHPGHPSDKDSIQAHMFQDGDGQGQCKLVP